MIQYHYQAIDPTHQKFVPYQVIVVAQLANETLYYMPQSWLYKQEHLLQQGEIDPHKFVGRDDRPEAGRWMPEGHHYSEVPEVCTAVLEQGTADIRRRVDSGELLCTDILDPDKLTTYIVDLQTPIWAAWSDAVETLHRAMAHISPQRMVAIIRDRKLSKSLRITESDLKSIAKHVCDVCVRSKSTRSSHTGSLIIDKRLGSTFAYDLQGPFNTPSIMYNNIYMFGIIEYNSRYVWPFFGKNKSDVYAIFKYWLENELTQIRALNSQLGQVTLVGDSGEAKSDNMRKILAQHAIKQVFTCD